MHADSHFVIGKDHEVCQDYAVTGKDKNGNPFVVVSDGCSSAIDTDVGSRLLANSLALQLKETGGFNMLEAIHRSIFLADNMGLVRDSLMATLFVARYTPKWVEVLMTGDGAVMARNRETGDISAWIVDSVSGAPEYLYYITNPEYHKKYKDEFGSQKDIHLLHIMEDEIVEHPNPAIFKDEVIIRLRLNSNDYDIVALATDGINTCNDLKAGEVVKRLMSIPNTTGEFVTRRLKRFAKMIGKEGHHNSDDIAMAAIYLGE